MFRSLRSFTVLALLALLSAPSVLATAIDCSCTSVQERQEWRTLTNDQKDEYINAVKCLQSLPAITDAEGVQTRFDDFQALHVHLTYEIHWVGQFLPWHRRFVQVYENTLRSECGYTGAQPYWDWTIDADANDVVNSPIFDPDHGFGGNGEYIPGWTGFFGNASATTSGGGCVQDGPFADLVLHIGPGTLVTDHCLVRTLNNNRISIMTTEQVANTTKQPTFELFRQETGGAFKPPPVKIHDGGHGSVGGEMGNVFSSPGDPLFFLHHANLDRVWWIWQSMKLPDRLSEISGPSTYEPPFTEVTLDFELKMNALGALLPISDVMDIRTSPMCYRYAT